MGVIEEAFGKTESGEEVIKYTIKNSSGLELSAISFGAALVSLKCPDRWVRNEIRTSRSRKQLVCVWKLIIYKPWATAHSNPIWNEKEWTMVFENAFNVETRLGTYFRFSHFLLLEERTGNAVAKPVSHVLKFRSIKTLRLWEGIHVYSDVYCHNETRIITTKLRWPRIRVKGGIMIVK